MRPAAGGDPAGQDRDPRFPPVADKDGFLSFRCPECHRTRLPHHSTCVIGRLANDGDAQDGTQ